MLLPIERRSREPLHRQIERELRRRIEAGEIPVGERLPPTRGLARTLGVHRSTVCAAYDALAAEGYVASRVGSGTRVVDRRAPAPRPRRTLPGGAAVDWDALLARTVATAGDLGGIASAAPARRTAGIVDFTTLIPDESLFPVDALRRCLNRVLRRDGAALLQYAATPGHPALREQLAVRMRALGMTVAADEIVVVNGAQQGLDLLCRLFLDPGDAVVVESPTYGNLLPLLRLHHADVVGIPMTPEGLDLDQMEHALQRHRVKFVYTMPHFHNPTGVTSSLEHRRRCLTIAARHRIAVVEDGFEADLRWDGGSVQPLRALEGGERVLYVGTFSKGLFPGLRIGWIVADPTLQPRLAHLKRTADYHTSGLLQATLAEFCAQGDYDRHLRRLRRVYRGRMEHTRRMLESCLPPEVTWQVPVGGYCIWLALPPQVSEEELVARLARDGVRVSPGRPFFVRPPRTGYLRLSISRVDAEEIARGLEILGHHVRALVHSTDAGKVPTRRPYI